MRSTAPSTAEIIDFASCERAERVNDPLAAWTKKEIYQECVWISEELTGTKIFLLCISRFFDDEAQSSSMSYKQVARECGLHESTAKAIARRLAGRWICIHVGRGYYVVGKGRTNLYDGIPPPDLVARLRDSLREGAGSPETTPNGNHGVASQYPELERGRLTPPRNAFSGSPETQAGSSDATRTTLPHKDKGKADAPPPSQKEDLAQVPPPSKKGASARKKDAAPKGPHMNCSRFVIDATKELFIEAEVLERWRRDFPHIPDLVAKLQALSVHFINGNQWVKFREFPHLYFTDKLAADNKRLAPKVGGARKSKAKPGELNLDTV